MSSLVVTTWYLEMKARPAAPARGTPQGVRLEHAPAPPLHFYRYLYETVGAPWLWSDRRRMSDEELASHVHDAHVEVWVAYRAGIPLGYFELDRRMEGACELAYFGLFPDAIGQGLGAWLLEAAVARAWSDAGTERLWVHTCSLDHPRALGIYERAGFARYAETSAEVWDPRPLPISPR